MLRNSGSKIYSKFISTWGGEVKKELTLCEVHDCKCWSNAKYCLKGIQVNISMIEGYNCQSLQLVRNKTPTLV